MPFEPIRFSRPIAPTDSINAATDFARYFVESGKHVSQWAIGAEVELFGFTESNIERITPEQVQAIINGFSPETLSRQIEDGYVTEALLGAGGRGSGAGEYENSKSEISNI